MALSDICFVDTETTGFSPSCAELIEIYMDDKDHEPLNCLIKPKSFIPMQITKLTGITNEMVKDAPRIEEIVPEIEKRLKNKIVVAHNAIFDLAFIQNEVCKFNGKANSIDYFCSLSAARRLLGLSSNSLPALTEYFNYEKEISHRAKGDALALEYIYYELMNIIDPAGIKKNSYFYKNEFVRSYTKFINDFVETKSYFQEQDVSPVLVNFMYYGAQRSSGKERKVLVESLRSDGEHIYFCGECLDSGISKQFRSDRIAGSVFFPEKEKSVQISVMQPFFCNLVPQH